MRVYRTGEDSLHAFGLSMRRLVDRTLNHLNNVSLETKEQSPLGFLHAWDKDSMVKCSVALECDDNGPLFLVLYQVAEAVQSGAGFRVRMRGYSYQIRDTPVVDAQALFQWSGARRSDDGEVVCKIHLPTIVTSRGGATLDLDVLRTPTGYVTLPDIVRFLIADLAVKPPCGQTWQDEVDLAYDWYRS